MADPRVNTIETLAVHLRVLKIPRSLELPGVKSMHSVGLMIIRAYGMPMVALKKLLSNTSPQA